MVGFSKISVSAAARRAFVQRADFALKHDFNNHVFSIILGFIPNH
jgi:hypothetical protein